MKPRRVFRLVASSLLKVSLARIPCSSAIFALVSLFTVSAAKMMESTAETVVMGGAIVITSPEVVVKTEDTVVVEIGFVVVDWVVVVVVRDWVVVVVVGGSVVVVVVGD